MAGQIAVPLRCSRLSAVVAVAVSLAIVACGGSSHARAHTGAKPQSTRTGGASTTPSDDAAKAPKRADPKRVAIVRAWSDALRAGNVAKAASYFAVPAVVQNGGPEYLLRNRDGVRAFNSSLPCGAIVVRGVRAGRYTIVTFKLTDRSKNPQGCGSVGHFAATAFGFRHGRISEWLRVTIPPSELKKAQRAAAAA